MIAVIFPGKVIIVAGGKLVRHERAWCYRESVRNCAKDGGGPPGAGLQAFLKFALLLSTK